MNILLFGGIFVVCVIVGYFIAGDKKAKVRCDINGGLFTISYRDRTIYVTNDGMRNSYKRSGDFEYINVVIGWDEESIVEVEEFIERSRTSILVRELFRFSAGNEPKLLMFFDPAHCKELVQVHQKLKAFVLT